MHIGPIIRAMLRNKVRFGVLAFEVALTLAIVANSVTLILDARQQLTRPSGFADDELITVAVSPFNQAFREDTFRDQVIDADLAALRALPGVVAATSTRFLPWQGGGSSTQFQRTADSPQLRTQIYSVDEALLDTLGLALVEGRMFTRDTVLANTALQRRAQAQAQAPDAAARDAAPPPTIDVVISHAYAQLMFPDGDVLGRTFTDNSGVPRRVIGVVGTFYNPYAWNIGEYVTFQPFRHGGYEGGFSYLVRTAPGQRDQVLGAIERTMLDVEAGRTLRVRRISDVRSLYQGPQTLLVRLLSLVIVAIVFITSLGIVGLTSFSVAERTRQIGTRRALGAAQGDILRHFLMENWMTTTAGVVLGVAMAIGLNALLLRSVDGPRLTPALVLGGAVMLWLAGLAATFWPAYRGARIAPAEATRNA